MCDPRQAAAAVECARVDVRAAICAAQVTRVRLRALQRRDQSGEKEAPVGDSYQFGNVQGDAGNIDKRQITAGGDVVQGSVDKSAVTAGGDAAAGSVDKRETTAQRDIAQGGDAALLKGLAWVVAAVLAGGAIWYGVNRGGGDAPAPPEPPAAGAAP